MYARVLVVPLPDENLLEPGSTAGRSAIDACLLKTFAETGVVKLERVFSEADAERMREVVWRDLYHTDGVVRDDRSTWHRKSPLRKLARAKRHPVFEAIFGESLRTFANALIGDGWTTSEAFGNLLVSFPDAARWHLPGLDGFWHSDYSGRHDPSDPLPSVRVFAVFGDVPPGGGGTLLVEGSDRLLMRFAHAHPEAERSHKAAHLAWYRAFPWLADLALAEVQPDRPAGVDDARRQRFMDTVTDVDGIACRVVEACGQPGDVYVCAPWTIHCRPPNASDGPRFLRAPTLVKRADPP